MILVDTSVWIDHLHRADDTLIDQLSNDQVATHPLVVAELALGSIKNRDAVIELLKGLAQFPVLRHDELLTLVDARKLWGRGLSAVDASLIGSALIADDAVL